MAAVRSQCLVFGLMAIVNEPVEVGMRKCIWIQII